MSARTKKFTPEIDAQLYDELIATGKKSGHTQRYVLEEGLAVLPAQRGPVSALGSS
jgi:hypothetical protein